MRTHTISATLDGKTASGTVTIATDGQAATVTLTYVHIYGAHWDGTSSSAWSRTDDAAAFTDPIPAVNNGAGSSPFDDLMPWSGMHIVQDAAAGKLVSIPKFWYKWTRSGATMKLQIADNAVEGFSLSPAHQDRRDGSGERDVVYVGRYHCADNYKSRAGVKPKASITRADARTGIHNLGSTIWQFDFAMLWTIWMLYIVEFADWNSQKVIGYGCGNNSGKENMGATDNMLYHTGTASANRRSYAVGCQYRWIEDLWGNAFDWVEGIYFTSGRDAYAIKNPALYSDANGGTCIGTAVGADGYISEWSNPSVSGFEWALLPSAAAGGESTYVCDYVDSDGGSNNYVMAFGSNYYQRQMFGLFHLSYAYTASQSNSNVGCRLQKLP